MIKQLIQVLFNKLGYHIGKKTTIETLFIENKEFKSEIEILRNENEKFKRMYYESNYGKYWDHYVSEDFNNVIKDVKDENGQPKYRWPGDEWGDQEFWNKVFDKLFVKHVPTESRFFVEIGPGSGKYSVLVLEEFRDAKLKCFDVSAEFLNVLKTRCQKHINEGGLEPILMDYNYRFLYDNLEHSEWIGKVDCLFSIDSMVHVDLQYLTAYWITAALALRIGGKLIMSLADATTDGGYAKLINDIAVYFPLQEKMSSKFEWISPDLVQSVLGRLGFEITASENLNNRDFLFVATLIQRKEIAQW